MQHKLIGSIKYIAAKACIKDNIVTRLNIRVRYRNRLSSFHLTSKFRWGQYFYVKVFQSYELFCWRINVVVGSRENCVQMYKPEFKVYKWDFSAEKSQFTRWIFLSIDHSRTVHNVQSSSTLFMHIIIALSWMDLKLFYTDFSLFFNRLQSTYIVFSCYNL